MSAFAVIYERTAAPVSPAVFNRVMERLNHRGPDGSDVLPMGPVIMGHWHFWTTPEEVGELQPLVINNSPLVIVFDGRIDNRREIIGQLAIAPADASYLSDAALLLKAYQRWGKACFARLVGEFALVIFDRDKNELVCARDHFGDRTLFFAPGDNRFVIASEPWAVLGASSSGPELNKNMAAHYFGLQASEDGQTFFAGVYELLPAHVMVIDACGYTTWRYWQPDPLKKVRFQTEKEYADHFLALLEESIRCRLRATTPVGVLMSGGLDSTSVACLAARMLSPQPLTTISNVYDELTECDEREYINAVKAQYGIHSLQVSSDDAWPYKDWQDRRHNPNQPEGNPYRINKERDYALAQENGLRVLFTGGSGDRLYIAGREWLADLLLEGRIGDALRGLRAQIQNQGIRQVAASGHLRLAIRVFLQKFAPWLLHLRHRKITYPTWLRQSAIEFLKKPRPWVDSALERHGTLLGLMSAYGCSREVFIASCYNVELRHPYRDRRLVEFVIGIPAYLLYSRGLYKHILRIAMQGILPEQIRTRKDATSLAPLFLRGLEREQTLMRENLSGDRQAWQVFVDAPWLMNRLDSFRPAGKTGRELFISWLCVSYEAWHKFLVSTH